MEIGYSHTCINAGDCAALTLPVTVEWESCIPTSGPNRKEFRRPNITKIGTTPIEQNLKGMVDKCNLSKDIVRKSKWHNESFPVGKNRKHQIKSWSETAKE